jgi:hypothetical protein
LEVARRLSIGRDAYLPVLRLSKGGTVVRGVSSPPSIGQPNKNNDALKRRAVPNWYSSAAFIGAASSVFICVYPRYPMLFCQTEASFSSNFFILYDYEEASAASCL